MIIAERGRGFAFAFRLFLALVFLVAGGSKVAQPWVFVHTVEGYRMLPDALTRPFALGLPWIEVLIGLYLLVGLFSRVTAVVTGLALAMFIFSLTVQILRGHTGDCGCVLGLDNPLVNAFVGGNTIGWWDVIRDSILLLMVATIYLAPRPPLFSLDAWLAGRRDEEDYEEEDYGTAPRAV